MLQYSYTDKNGKKYTVSLDCTIEELIEQYSDYTRYEWFWLGHRVRIREFARNNGIKTLIDYYRSRNIDVQVDEA